MKNVTQHKKAVRKPKPKIVLTLSTPCISASCIEIEINLVFVFTLLCGASKGFMKVFKTI